MDANTNKQLAGGCREVPGVDRMYRVSGATYPFRGYFKRIGLSWEPEKQVWSGELGEGRAWFIREKLRLDIREKMIIVLHLTPEKIRRLRAMRRMRTEPEGVKTRWEECSAVPVDRMDTHVRATKNINERGCHWGSELCKSCMECISNIDENDVRPHPELDFWDSQEETERANATMPAGA
jgi:hypothetical protein